MQKVFEIILLFTKFNSCIFKALQVGLRRKEAESLSD